MVYSWFVLQKVKRVGKRQDNSQRLLRRACVSPENPQCSGGAVSASSMAEPASLPLSAVSVSASNSRHSTRKRASPTQPQTEAKRPRTRSQDTTAALTPTESSSGGRGKSRTRSETPITKNSNRTPRHIFDKLNSSPNLSTNSKIHKIGRTNQNSVDDYPTTSKANKASISFTESSGTEPQHRRAHSRKTQSTGSAKHTDDFPEAHVKTRRASRVEAGTSFWEVTTHKTKPSLRDSSSSKSPESDISVHKYPLRNHVRLSSAGNSKSTSPSTKSTRGDSKSPSTNRRKNKVRINNLKKSFLFGVNILYGLIV